jgi:hypothetical protein
MSSEPRHGPVTMHRAIERAMLKRIAARPADAPRARPASEDAPAAAGEAAADGRDPALLRGGGTGSPKRVRRERQR